MSLGSSFFEQVFNHIHGAIICTDLEGKIIYWNKGASELYQWQLHEVLGEHILGFTAPSFNHTMATKVLEDLQKNGFWEGELTAIHKDGTRHLVKIYNSLLRDSQGQPIGIVGLSIPHSQSTERSADAQHLDLTALENSEAIIARFNRSLQCIDINPAIEKVTGLPPKAFIGKSYRDIGVLTEAYTAFNDHLSEVFESGIAATYETSYTVKDKKKFFETHLVPEFIGIHVEQVLAICRDITEKRSINLELSRLDKLNLVGEMAASIGHEVRNPLTTVRGFLQMFLMKNHYSETDNEHFSIMITELDRANAIITEFLSLAKNKARHLCLSNINQIIETLYPLIQADALHSGKDLHLTLTPLPNLLVDESEIRQLLLNLVRNGIQAMPEKGTVTISTYAQDRDIVIVVKDEGRGIPPEVAEKLGTPFFTTKENGTGLGLAICYSIAARHNAQIKIDSSSSGTKISVIFKLPDPK